MPQRFRDFGVAALAIVAVFVALTRIDGRVPGELTHAFGQLVNGRWIQPSSPVGSVWASVSANPALDNLIVVAFLAAGVVLVILMVRT